MNTTQSPEITGAWLCACGNKTEFVGVDARGYGGPDCCEGSETLGGIALMTSACPNDYLNEGVCLCETELTQEFTVLYDDDGKPTDYDYQSYEGGGSDGEIGEYTKIVCAECGATLWEEEGAQ